MVNPWLAVAALAALAACAPFPDVAALAPDTAAPPVLLPIDDLLALADAASRDPAPDLEARAARLKARAAAIKSP